MNIDDLSLEELKDLHKRTGKAIESYETRKRQEALAAAEARAKEMGFTLSELVGTGKSSKKVSAPKYRHPENHELTWTGRGRQPNWFREAINSGTNPDDLLIVK